MFAKQESDHSIFNRDWQAHTEEPQKPTRKAFETKHVISRYEFLERQFPGDPQKIREVLLKELTDDLLTYVGEFTAVKSFAFAYQIVDGELVEDSPVKNLVQEMFLNFPSVESNVWIEQVIPTMEQMPVGTSIFWLSTRRDDGEVVEGSHDYAYFFSKVDDSRIEANGVELNLSKTQVLQILNNQIKSELLNDSDNWVSFRQQLYVYFPGSFTSPQHAYAEIIGKALQEEQLSQPFLWEHLIERERSKLDQHESYARSLAQKLIDKIINSHSDTDVQKLITEENTRLLKRYYPEHYEMLREQGTKILILPCGAIDFASSGNSSVSVGGMDLRFSAGLGLTEIMECVKCPFCHKTVDAIVTADKIKCPKCKAEAHKK